MSTKRGVISGQVRECLAKGGERTLVTYGGKTLSYAQTEAAAREAADVLTAALGTRQARIGFYLKNCPDYLSGYFGALHAGHVPFLLDAAFNAAELEAIRDDCGVEALLVETSAVGKLTLPVEGAPAALGDGVSLVKLRPSQHPAPALLETTEVCRFTSGSTGKAKCLEFSGDAVVAAAKGWAAGTSLGEDDRTLCLAALSNGLAFNTSLLSSLLCCAELHLFSGMPLTRSVAAAVRKHRITRLVAFPTLYRLFVEEEAPAKEQLASLRFALSAGAPLWPDVRALFVERYGVGIADYYGIAETGPCTFEADAEHQEGLGRALPGVELRIVKEDGQPQGEVCVRTQSMASRYLNHPGLLEARVDAEGFYRSGDTGTLREGRLYLQGRTQDHINVGGRKVDPREVASVVEKLPGVTEALAIPDTDAQRETFVHLVVVAKGVATKVLLDACRERLAPYKVPSKVSFVDEIPKNGIGKPRLHALRERLESMRKGDNP